MKNTEIRETVAELQELYAVQDVLKAQITEREQAIKDEMESRELQAFFQIDLIQQTLRSYIKTYTMSL